MAEENAGFAADDLALINTDEGGAAIEGTEGTESATTGTDDAGGEGKGKGNGKAAADAGKKSNGADAGAGDGASDDWRASITDEKLRDHAGRFASVSDLVKANLDSRQKLSTAIIPPGKDASDEDIAAFNKRMGVPDDVSGYAFPKPAEGQELTDAEKASQEDWAKTFHDLGVPKKTAEALIQKHSEVMAALAEDVAARDKQFADESEAALRKEWPGKQYDENIAIAAEAGQKLFGEDYEAARGLLTKDDKLVLDHPILSKMLARVGREMSEGGVGPMSESQRQTFQERADEARNKREKARAEGDADAAKRFDDEERKWLTKIHGDEQL